MLRTLNQQEGNCLCIEPMMADEEGQVLPDINNKDFTDKLSNLICFRIDLIYIEYFIFIFRTAQA